MYKKHFYHYLDQNESFNMLLLSMLIFCLFNFALFKNSTKENYIVCKERFTCQKFSMSSITGDISSNSQIKFQLRNRRTINERGINDSRKHSLPGKKTIELLTTRYI